MFFVILTSHNDRKEKNTIYKLLLYMLLPDVKSFEMNKGMYIYLERRGSSYLLRI